MRPRNASGQDACCLLQGRKSQGEAPEHEVRLPRVHLQATGREKSQTKQSVCELLPGGQRESSEIHAGNHRTELSLRDISRLHNPVLRGWVAYYGRFYPSAMYPVFRHFNKTLVAWAMRKYRRLKRHKIRASLFLENVAENQPHLFVHWKNGTVGAFA